MTQQPEQDYRKYYAEQLEAGLIFQDVVTRALYQRGIVLVGYASRRFQVKEGENMLGAEIKRDGQFRTTGNLYIEVAEKANPANSDYVPSGIHRKDNSWLFVIGDEGTIWVFATKNLRVLQSWQRFKEITKDSSQGFLLPVAEADKYSILKLTMVD